jgi:hypothetical protein
MEDALDDVIRIAPGRGGEIKNELILMMRQSHYQRTSRQIPASSTIRTENVDNPRF